MPGSIRISADSTCDLSPEQLSRYDIGIIPLYISLGDESMKDGVEITAQTIYDYVAKTGQLPKTAAPSVADYLEFFRERQTSPDDILIHFTISSKFSSSYQNACIAAAEYNNVTVIDSQNLSTGHGHAVMEAAVMKEHGASAEEIVEHVKKIIPKIRASFVIDRLDYLYKGGRCSGVAALGANLLKLKPCIEVVDGEMKVGKKYRGTIDKVLPLYTADKLTGKKMKKELIFITHTGCSREVVESVRNKINELYQFDEVVETIAGSTITSHCGQNTLGVLYIEE
jgi:DegV family protein with EDD domain